ncbi:MAG: hypothetical protein QM619_16530 [Micropruina sp.]|uniref:FtsX-like permease family protein n=1 Tax=Micropruina sp. TaxID=2737536 RepID=UPI0039E51C44
MSTAVAARTASDVPFGPAQPRARSWWTGWRLALRMARRDVRRDRGRSWFVWLMIAVPVAILAATQVLVASFDLSPIERARLATGGNQAVIDWWGHPFEPSLNSYGSVVPEDEPASSEAPALPGWGTSLASREAAVARFLDRPVSAITWSSPTFGVAEVGLIMVGADPRSPAMADVIRLTEGRLPASPSEVLVTARGVRSGLPTSGDVRLTLGDTAAGYTVVGRADLQLLGSYDLLGYPQQVSEELGFLVPGDQPVTWEDATRLAGHGFTTTSVQIVARPPRALPRSGLGFGIGDVALVVGLVEVALLVGPAFAIGAARQRRSLALAALNGADPRQLRRVALGQALLLGSTATLTGTLVGTAAGVALWPAMASDSTETHGPLEVPIVPLVLLLALGVLTALGSALVTARGLARLALVSALSGTTRSAPPGRGAPIAGVLLLVAGVAATWWSITLPRDGNSMIGWVALGGGLAALAGLLFSTPALLRILARLGAGAPVALRMALRDLARHRGRATAIVASVAGGVLILTAVWTAMGSTDADRTRRYIPATRAGQAVITGVESESGLAGVAATVRSVDPRLRTTPVAGASVPKPGGDEGTLDIAGLRKGCTAADLFDEQGRETPRCRSVLGYSDSGILVGATADLVRLFGLDSAQADALAHGRLLVNTDPVPGFEGTSVNELDRGRLHVAYVDYMERAKSRTEWLPAVAISTDVIGRGAPPARYSVLASTSTAAALGWSVEYWRLLVDDPDGPITPATESALREALAAPGIHVQVEHGFVPEPQPVLWLIAGTLALLAVIGAAMSTILAATDLRPFLATFTAVGAPPTLTRRLAMAQAAVLGLLASGLGSLLGMALGAPLAVISTTSDGAEPVVALPWLAAGLFAIGVPLVAGVVATLSRTERLPRHDQRNHLHDSPPSRDNTQTSRRYRPRSTCMGPICTLQLGNAGMNRRLYLSEYSSAATRGLRSRRTDRQEDPPRPVAG